MMACDPLARRARFSLEPDVEVEVEGHVFKVHSYVLMSQSPVFQNMLGADMREGHDGRVVLRNKKKNEFEEFLRHLRTPGSAVPPEIEYDVAKWLVAWAHEYDVEILRARCEEVLCEHDDLDFDMLALAMKFGLEKLRYNCLVAIQNNVFEHRNRLHELWNQPHVPELGEEEEEWPDGDGHGDADKILSSNDVDGRGDTDKKSGPRQEEAKRTTVRDGEAVDMVKDQSLFIELFLPAIYKSVLLADPKLEELPSKSRLTVEALWPVVVRAIEMAHGWRDVEEIRATAKRIASRERLVLKALPWEGDFLTQVAPLIENSARRRRSSSSSGRRKFVRRRKPSVTCKATTKGLSFKELFDRLQYHQAWSENSELHHVLYRLEKKKLITRKTNGRFKRVSEATVDEG